MDEYDLLVIGAGPGGYSVAIAAAKKGLRVTVFEKQYLGGTCLNVGCIPTKYLLDKANAMEKIRNLTNEKIIRNAGLFSIREIQSRKRSVTSKLTGGVDSLMKSLGIKVVMGEAVLDKNRIVSCNGEKFKGKNIVIATGSVPVVLPIPGSEYTIDSTAALNLEHIPRKMVVMGGGVIGLELASAFNSFGAEVTVVEMLPHLLPKDQNEAVSLLVSSLERHGIKIQTNAKMTKIEKSNDGSLKAYYEKDGKGFSVDADQVLMAVGRRPNLYGIDAEKIGLKIDRKHYIVVDEYQRTNLENVYAIGDVTGGVQLAHAAYAEGNIALSCITGCPQKMGTMPIPHCIYTIPCYASVGLSTQAAEELGKHTFMGTFPYSANGMALAEGASGIAYVVMDKNSMETLGVTIVGPDSSELINLATLAVAKHLTLDEWRHLVIAHPSLSEILREAALDAFGEAVHKR